MYWNRLEKFFGVVAAFIWLLVSGEAFLFRDPVSLRVGRYLSSSKKPPPYKWSEEWYHGMPIDHFSFADARNFSLRYLINLNTYKPNGPIFFYTGNEGAIESFATNTGFVWDIAPDYKAAIVFAEHRFYGQTKPFGNESYTNVKNLGYLSSEQALADFAELIVFLKQQRIPKAKKAAVIAFGGSYGGMLTAWMRIKYPHIVDGGIAASAPVFWFQNAQIPNDIFDKIVTRTFSLSGCNKSGLMASFKAIIQLSESADNWTFLNEAFHLSKNSLIQSPADGLELVKSLQGLMETLAMVDYPYAADFLADLPAWPVRAVCQSFTNSSKGSDRENAVRATSISQIFYNASGKSYDPFCLIGNCPGPFSALGDALGWSWQTCTEMVMPMCSSGPPNDVFEKTCPFSLEKTKTDCELLFKNIGYDSRTFRPNWTIINYGEIFPTATNIVFSNGYLDPWSGGGWNLKSLKKGSLVSLIVEDGAHHLDLRGSNSLDTDSVKEVRRIEKLYISRWIHEANDRHQLKQSSLKFRPSRLDIRN